MSNYAWSDLDWASLPGDGRADHPLTGDFFPELWPSLVADTDHDITLLLAQRCSHGGGYSSDGTDDGQAAWDASRRMAKAAAWDLSGWCTRSWGLDQGDAVAVAGVDRGSVDEDTIGLAAWAAARDAAFCACTNGTLARQTFKHLRGPLRCVARVSRG